MNVQNSLQLSALWRSLGMRPGADATAVHTSDVAPTLSLGMLPGDVLGFEPRQFLTAQHIAGGAGNFIRVAASVRSGFYIESLFQPAAAW